MSGCLVPYPWGIWGWPGLGMQPIIDQPGASLLLSRDAFTLLDMTDRPALYAFITRNFAETDFSQSSTQWP